MKRCPFQGAISEAMLAFFDPLFAKPRTRSQDQDSWMVFCHDTRIFYNTT